MLILLRLHFLKDLSGCGVIVFQSRGEVRVNARIRFLGRNCQRQNFLFRKIFEILCHGIFYRYFFATSGAGEEAGVAAMLVFGFSSDFTWTWTPSTKSSFGLM